MAEGTRLKGQAAIDRLQEELADIRVELSELHQLKQDVQSIQSDLVALPRMDKKLTEMETSLHTVLQQILLQTAPAPPPAPDLTSASTQNQKEQHHQGNTAGMHSAPLPVTDSQSAFQHVSTTMPGPSVPTATITSSPQVVFTDSTTVTAAKDSVSSAGPFRLSTPAVPTLRSSRELLFARFFFLEDVN